MALSYLLLFLYILLFFMGVLNSSNHILKSAVCCFVSMAIITIYLYLEHTFANLTSYVSMRAYFYYLLLDFFSKRQLTEADGNFVAEGIYILLLFLIIYSVIYVILTLFSFGDAPKRSIKDRRKKALYLLFYYACWGFMMTFIISLASPVFNNVPLGFLSSLINSLKWEIVK